jgi:hypothetical protein
MADKDDRALEARADLSPARARVIEALARERQELEARLAEIHEAIQDLGMVYALALDLPIGRYSFVGDGAGRVQLIVHYTCTDEELGEPPEAI